MMESNYNYEISSKNWNKHLLERNLDLFVDFKVIPDIETEFNPKEENEVKITINIKKKED